jgi:hypothetical protein
MRIKDENQQGELFFPMDNITQIAILSIYY